MKIIRYITLLSLLAVVFSCVDLNVPPINEVQDKDIFKDESGIMSYMARIYAEMPIEDFRYSPLKMFDRADTENQPATITGEALCDSPVSDIQGAMTETEDESLAYWNNAYKLIRDVNYFIETLPKYAENFTKDQMNNWTGEAYFIRGFTYFSLAKRYGGIPLVNRVLDPSEDISKLQIPRSSEAATYDQIAADFDKAYTLLPETNQSGRASRYAAAAMKSRAMLFAGSIAKYSSIELFDKNKNQLCGIPRQQAAHYFKLSYDAAKLLENKFSLYLKNWQPNDKEAQYQNYVNLFFDADSPENVFVKPFIYPDLTHSYDCFNVPYQFLVASRGGALNPTLDFVEMFDGLPKLPNGKINVCNPDGTYKLYKNQMDFFKDAEPRLRATVIFPGDKFKDETVEIWRGIYTADVNGGIPRLLPDGTRVPYEESPAKDKLVSSPTNEDQHVYVLPDGSKMNGSGRSGRFYSKPQPAMAGFAIRKWMNPAMKRDDVREGRSAQAWIEIRYAEVLLNRAEAAFELASEGHSEIDYRSDAYALINQIRQRAGADLLPDAGALTIDAIRTERRKELGFENKIWWDLKRWRIMDEEQNSRVYRELMPFYAAKADNGKGMWFFDDRYEEENISFIFDPKWYYEKIKQSEINSNPSLVQNPGY